LIECSFRPTLSRNDSRRTFRQVLKDFEERTARSIAKRDKLIE